MSFFSTTVSYRYPSRRRYVRRWRPIQWYRGNQYRRKFYTRRGWSGTNKQLARPSVVESGSGYRPRPRHKGHHQHKQKEHHYKHAMYIPYAERGPSTLQQAVKKENIEPVKSKSSSGTKNRRKHDAMIEMIVAEEREPTKEEWDQWSVDTKLEYFYEEEKYKSQEDGEDKEFTVSDAVLEGEDKLNNIGSHQGAENVAHDVGGLDENQTGIAMDKGTHNVGEKGSHP